MSMLAILLSRIPCPLRHWWVYDATACDALRRPIRRICARCKEEQERRYNGYDRSAFGDWKSVRR